MSRHDRARSGCRRCFCQRRSRDSHEQSGWPFLLSRRSEFAGWIRRRRSMGSIAWHNGFGRNITTWKFRRRLSSLSWRCSRSILRVDIGTERAARPIVRAGRRFWGLAGAWLPAPGSCSPSEPLAVPVQRKLAALPVDPSGSRLARPLRPRRWPIPPLGQWCFPLPGLSKVSLGVCLRALPVPADRLQPEVRVLDPTSSARP